MSHISKLFPPYVCFVKEVVAKHSLRPLIPLVCIFLLSSVAYANNQTYSTNGTYTWTAPSGVTSIQVECWGPGGNGGGNNGPIAGGGGGGGAYAKRNSYSVTPGNNYTVVVGNASNSNASAAQTSFDGTGCIADFGLDGGINGYAGNGGTGGSAGASVGDVTTSGTSGGQGYYAGSAGAGGAGANGGAGGNPNNNGGTPGGGGGGTAVSWIGPGSGADGQVVITWTPATVATPTLSPNAGTYTSAQSVTISTTTSGATIRYTTDGTTPSETAGTVYSSAISVSVSQTIKAIAYKTSMTDSAVATAVYSITGTVAAPTFSPSGGTFTSAQSVTLNTTTTGASIRYTTDGSTPSETAGTLYSGPVSLGLNSTTTVKAMAYLSGWLDSSVASATYTITGTVAAPTFNPIAGTYQTSQSIALSSTNSGATIRYTTDGTTPTETYGTVYSSPISLNTIPNVATTTTIKAIGYQSTWLDSSVSSGTFTITGTVAQPTFSPLPGTYTALQTITISTATGGSTIRYTTDGSTPTETYGTVYSSPVALNQNTTLSAIAYKSGWTDSTVTSGSYLYTSPRGGGGGSGPGTGNPNADSGNGLDPRRVGVRSFGAYWGAAGEQIDTTSGNLNFSLPLLKIVSRGSWSVGAMLNYNSQIWRQDSAGTWLMGFDVGYGIGWQVQIGSLVPTWANGQIDHYIYTDPTGAEYKLSVNNSGVWTSNEGTYISYDSNTNRLYATDGSFRVMGSTSSGGEQDAGRMYPTQIEDPNGNYIAIQYAPGTGSGGWPNTSARIQYIYDPRISNDLNGYLQTPSYTFTYNNDQIPHLTSISGLPGESYTFGVLDNQALNSPFDGTSFGTTSLLTSLTVTGLPTSHLFTYGTSGEMATMTTPLGGQLSWTYGSCTYTGSIKQREVVSRQTNAFTDTWTFTPADSCNGSQTYHVTMTLKDTALGTTKAYTAGSPIAGYVVPTAYDEANADTSRNLHKDFGWVQDGYGNIYMNSVTTTMNPGTSAAIQTASVQTLDAYGNLSQSQVYDYGNLTTPARTYNTTYLTDPNYVSRHIVNKLTQATVSTSSGTVYLVYANYYDGNRPGGPTQPPYCGSNNVTPPGLPSMHDTAYNTSFNYRGNLTYTVSFGGTYCYDYFQATGVPADTQDITGNTIASTPSLNSNYSLPGVLTPNGNSNLATTVSYAGSWAVSSVTAPNGATSNTTYDAWGRPQSSTSSDGAVTNYTYSYNPNIQTATITTGSATQWKKTYLDGFGRTLAVQTGHDSTTVNEVDTEYAACACSPLGKVYAVSLPYAPGAGPIWTVYTYDGSGRTLTVTKPDGASKTTYAYSGNTTTVTDPAGKWKTNKIDAFGNLSSVTEPDPNNQPGGTLVTSYTYNSTNQLIQVTMPRSNGTQTRIFSWNGTDLASATNPENGTVTYQYDGAHHVTLRTDAKGQQTKYAYDINGRLSTVTHAASASQMSGATPDVNYYYDSNPFNSGYTQNGWGHLTAVTFGGMNYYNNLSGGTQYYVTLTPQYMYSYNQAGRLIDQNFQITRYYTGDQSSSVWSFDAAYTWDNQGRMTARNGPDANYSYAYDSMGRLSTMSGGASAAAQYNAAGQMTSLSYDTFSETRTYNTLLQLTRQTTSQSGLGNVMDMQYIYSATQNNGRIMQTIDGVASETVNYTYDALNRLSTAGSSSGSWSQAYTYDGFGNLTGTNGAAVNSFNPATNQPTNQAYDANGLPNPTVPLGGQNFSLYSWDVENRLITTGAINGYNYFPNGSNYYGYDPSNKRVFQIVGENLPYTSGGSPTAYAYFYSTSGQKLATIQCTSTCNITSANLYFGTKMIRSNGLTVATDRSGSVRANSNGERMSYYPYGQERTSTADSREKFGTFLRDGPGQDYADQRYYNQAGAFWSPDPDGIKAADQSNPGSWNRYAYAYSDPINYYDPQGLIALPQQGQGPATGYNPSSGTSGAGASGGGGGSDGMQIINDDGGGGGGAGPDCNPTGNSVTQMKINFVSANWSAAMADAQAVQTAVEGAAGNSNLTINTAALATVFLQWSANESHYGTNPQNIAQNNMFGQQVGFAGSITCPTNPNIPANTKNACFSASTTWGEELTGALDATPQGKTTSYLDALVNSLIKNSNESPAAMLQSIASNGWNSANPNYGRDLTTNMKIQSVISCLGLH